MYLPQQTFLPAWARTEAVRNHTQIKYSNILYEYSKQTVGANKINIKLNFVVLNLIILHTIYICIFEELKYIDKHFFNLLGRQFN